MADEFKYKHRAGTAAQWADPQDGPLLRGEIGVLLDDNGAPLGAKIGDGETAFDALPDLGGNATSLPAVEEATTARTLQPSDAGKVVEATNASATTVTVPPNSSVSFPLGTVINIYSAGAGGVTIAAGSGVTIRNLTSLAQYRECSLRKRGTDEWVQVG